ncbi:MAG: hypothetical protein WBD57_07900 [Candidatus Cybelea sp.]
MMKLHNILLACALGAGSLLGAAAPASAAHVSVGTVRSATTGRVLPYYGTGYRSYGYPYRSGYGYPYHYGVGVGVGVGYGYPSGGYGYVGGGYGYTGGAYGYAPYPAVYPRRAWVRRPYWRPYRRAY